MLNKVWPVLLAAILVIATWTAVTSYSTTPRHIASDRSLELIHKLEAILKDSKESAATADPSVRTLHQDLVQKLEGALSEGRAAAGDDLVKSIQKQLVDENTLLKTVDAKLDTLLSRGGAASERSGSEVAVVDADPPHAVAEPRNYNYTGGEFAPSRIRDTTHDALDKAWCAVHNDSLYCSKYHIVIMAYDEDPSWVKFLYPDWTHTIYNHRDTTSINFIGPNLGREAHGYLRFIVDHYDTLPEFTVFSHGYFHADTLPPSRCIPEDTYWSPLANWHCLDRFHGGNAHKSNYMETFAALFDGYRDTTEDLLTTTHYCCASFVASRRAIRDRPLEFWKRALWMTHSGTFREPGYGFEEIWHIIFHEKTKMNKIPWCLRFPCECDRSLLPPGLHEWYAIPMPKFEVPVYDAWHQKRHERMAEAKTKRHPKGVNMPPTDFDW